MMRFGNVPVGLVGAALLVAGAWSQVVTAGDDPHDVALKAFQLRLAGQVDSAVETLEAGLAAHPEAGVLHYEMARTRLYLLDIPGLHEEAGAAIESAPDNNDYRYFAAQAAAYGLIDAAHHNDRDKMAKMGQEVLDQLETILAEDPDDHRARYFLVQQSVEMAPEVGLEPHDPEANTALLEAKDPIWGAKARCCLVGEKEQKKIWQRILADHPDDCRALSEAAEGLIAVGDLERAEDCLNAAIAKDHEHCYGLLRLGLAYVMKQDWDRAIALTERYLELDPPVALKAFATGRLGIIHQRKGDRNRGRELMEEARRIDPHVWLTVMPPPQEIFTPL